MAGDNMDLLGAGAKGWFGGMAKGATTGASIGSVIPGVGTVLGGAIGAGLGANIGALSAISKQNKANKSQEIPMTDPIEARRLAELEQLRRNVMMGSDPITQNRINQARNVGSAVQGAISRNTGGDVASTMDALLKAQRNTQAGVNQGISEGQQSLPYFDNASGQLMQRIAQRKLELQLLKRAQATAENAQSRKEDNLSANAASSSGILDGMFQNKLNMNNTNQQGMLTPTVDQVSPQQQMFDPTSATNVSGDWASSLGSQSLPMLGM